MAAVDTRPIRENSVSGDARRRNGFFKSLWLAFFAEPVHPHDEQYKLEPDDELYTDAIGDVYARKPDGRVYDLTD